VNNAEQEREGISSDKKRKVKNAEQTSEVKHHEQI
jgi:hypothetical protein